jgi:predicted nuclease of predicted toxin-antitoxin system
MKILIDECIDRRLAKDLIGYEVKTVPQMGWAGIKNGTLLALASSEFDIFLTVDQNLPFQQNLPQFDISVIVLQTKSNRLADLKPLIPKILTTIPNVQKGQANIINMEKEIGF